MSMELISREEALDCSIYAHDWNSYSDLIAELPTVKAIPIETLEQIRAEIEQEYNKFRNMSDKWDERACGLGTALEIIDKANKEQDEWGLEHDIINNNSGI